MKIQRVSAGRFVIDASEDELLVLNNALNEVCNGLPIRDFETRIGMPLEFAESMLREVGAALDGDSEN
jgi:hypothetical protein